MNTFDGMVLMGRPTYSDKNLSLCHFVPHT